MAHLKAAACPAHHSPLHNSHLLRIADAVGDLDRPMLALQAVGQLTHPTSAAPDSITLELVDRTALGYLLEVIEQDFVRVRAAITNTIDCEEI